MHFIKSIFKDLFHERTRIILTVLAIAWGTFSISTMLAIGEGLRLTFAKAVESSGQNYLTLAGGRTSKEYLGTHPNTQINLTQKDFKAIKSLPNIATVSAEYDIPVAITANGNSIKTVVKAVSPEYFTIHHITVGQGGRVFNAIDMQNRQPVIVLGRHFKKELFPDLPDESVLGKMVLVGNQPFVVIGVMQKRPQLIISEAPEDFFDWIPVSVYELLANPTSIGSMSITYKDLGLLPQTKQAIQKVIALDHGTDPNDADIVDFSDLAKAQKTVNTFFAGMQIFLGVIGMLTLLVAGVGVANVMYVSVRRATHEIGLRMALGARAYNILTHYIFESFLVTLLGGIIGLIIAGALVYGMRKIPFSGKLIDIIGQPHPVLSLNVFFVVILVLGIIGFLSGIFPALKAASIDPAKALTYE
jgi:putative ABC transport system permease protein